MCSAHRLTEGNEMKIALRVPEIWSGNKLKGKSHDFEVWP